MDYCFWYCLGDTANKFDTCACLTPAREDDVYCLFPRYCDNTGWIQQNVLSKPPWGCDKIVLLGNDREKIQGLHQQIDLDQGLHICSMVSFPKMSFPSSVGKKHALHLQTNKIFNSIDSCR
jgi:hypothetical protein